MDIGEFSLERYDDSYSFLVEGLGCAKAIEGALDSAIGYCRADDLEPSLRANRSAESWGESLCVLFKDYFDKEKFYWFHIPVSILVDPERVNLDRFDFVDYVFEGVETSIPNPEQLLRQNAKIISAILRKEDKDATV